MSEELKPCPYCGGKAELVPCRYLPTTVAGEFYKAVLVQCLMCPAEMASMPMDEDGSKVAERLTAKWNTRHVTDRGVILDEIYTEAAKIIDLNDLRATFLADMEKRGPGTRFGLDRAVWAVAEQAFLVGLAHAEKRKPLGGDDVNNWSLEN